MKAIIPCLLVVLLNIPSTDARDIDKRLSVYAEKLLDQIRNKFKENSSYNDFAEAFKRVKIADGNYKLGARLYSITIGDIENTMKNLEAQVKEIARRAEESFYVTDPNGSTSFFDGDLDYYSIQGAEVKNNPNRTIKLSNQPDGHYGIRINTNASVVRVAIDMYKGDPRVRHDVKVTANLEQLFQKNYQKSQLSKDDFVFQLFATQNGVTRVFPAHHLAEFRYTKRGTREYFDGRDRVWYIEAVSPPKDIIFMIDFSGSMEGLAQNIAKNLLKIIFQHTPSYDYINIVIIREKPLLPSPCFNRTLEKATEEIKRHLLDSLEEVKNQNRANFTEALKLAFEVFNRSEAEGKTNSCTKTLVIISDGDVSNYQAIFEEKNQQMNGKKVRVIAFRTETTMERNVLETDHKKDAEIIAMACGNGGLFVRLKDNHEIFDALRIYTEFFVPTKESYTNSTDVHSDDMLTKWTSLHTSYSNTGPTVTLAHPVVVAKSYNYSYHFPRYNVTGVNNGPRIVHAERKRIKREGLATRLLGVAAVDYPMFQVYRQDNVLSNYVRVITMKDEYLMSHPDLTSTDRKFEFLQIERGTDMDKLEGIQSKSAHRHDVFYKNLNTYLEPFHTPLGREILINTYYMLTPVKNTPFTVGLSLPVLADFQYEFTNFEEIDRGRQALLNHKDRIIFKGFLGDQCMPTLKFLGREDIKEVLNKNILETLNRLNSTSDPIADELLCTYDIYLSALMEGYLLQDILEKWEKEEANEPPQVKTYFHSVGGNIFVTPKQGVDPSFTTNPKEDVMFAKALTVDPVDTLYLSLGRAIDDTKETYFNISQRVVLPQTQGTPDRVAGMLTAQIPVDSICSKIRWLGMNLITDEKMVLYILDEFGYVVLVLLQQDTLWCETLSSSLSYNLAGSLYHHRGGPSGNLTFFGEIQPWIMRYMIGEGYYHQSTLDRCREACDVVEEVSYNDPADAAALPLRSILTSLWVVVHQLITSILLYPFLHVLPLTPGTQNVVRHYGLVKSPDFCCNAHHTFKKDFGKTDQTYGNCIARSNDPNEGGGGSCCSKTIYVQPVLGTNLLLVLDMDRSTTCVRQSNDTRNKCACPCAGICDVDLADEMDPFTNRDGNLRSSLTPCRYNYTKVSNIEHYPCLERINDKCMSKGHSIRRVSYALVVVCFVLYGFREA